MAVDYDPKKAHEYYERHKQLKGRRSTRKFTESQREQWAYAKQQLSDEHKEIKSKISSDAKSKKQEISERTKAAIAKLRERLKGMSKEERARWRDQIKTMISELRNSANANKKNLTEDAKSLREKEAGDYEKRKDDAYEKIKSM